MNAPSKYTCDQLGVCQCATPRCATCQLTTPQPRPEQEQPTSWDQIAAMVAQVAIAASTVAVVFGVAGYIWGQA